MNANRRLERLEQRHRAERDPAPFVVPLLPGERPRPGELLIRTPLAVPEALWREAANEVKP